ALAANHTISIGSSGLNIAPNVTHAVPGDLLIFRFFPGHHNVASGPFGTPCQSSATGGGIFSGWVDASDKEQGAAQIFVVEVNDTEPLWLYCSTPHHCSNGQVAVVNPPSDRSQTLEQYLGAARSTDQSSQPDGIIGGAL
ncbi:hypothetical protein P152DRAFT_369051, partial [Eremomyces bilateralis CBS 781.70]